MDYVYVDITPNKRCHTNFMILKINNSPDLRIYRKNPQNIRTKFLILHPIISNEETNLPTKNSKLIIKCNNLEFTLLANLFCTVANTY